MATEYLHAVPPLLSALTGTAVLVVGGLRVMDGHLTIGTLVAFQSLMAYFMGPVEELVGVGSILQEVEGEIGRLDDVLRHPLDPHLDPSLEGTPPEAGRDLPTRLRGGLDLREISFGYNRLGQPLIQDFSLSLRPGSRVALVGSTGSGKSTVARLVCGLYPPWKGEIRFDDLLLNQIPRGVRANSVGMVDQEIFLFEGTVRDNLTLWDHGVAEADIVRAARDACIHEEIAARPGGYERRIEEGGGNFSGGQRQRLEIARALVSNPTIVVLDEATSALDPVPEQMVDENLRRRGCTCLIIAHRLSTIRDCDEILVLEQGKVVQRGTHDEMAAGDGPYARLISTEG